MNLKGKLLILFTLFALGPCFGQTSMNITAVLNDSIQTFNIQQEIIYENSGEDSLTVIYLNDWANSYKDKSTPLADRFAEDYIRRFHFARAGERGSTKIYSITDENVRVYSWERPGGNPDLIRINLPQPLLPGKKVTINLLYQVKVPSEKFTRFGFDDLGNYKLK